MKVSAVILTFNEERNIGRCLESLSWCNEIVVVDSGSTDKTVEICKRHDATVLFRRFDNFANQRNYALDEHVFTNEWILHLDADEVLTQRFIEVLNEMEPEAELHAYNVPSRTILLGKWIKHAGMWPTYQVRLGHRDKLRFKQVGHGQREDLSPDQVGVFPEAYDHFSFSHGLEKWFSKHIRYASDEAKLLIDYRNNAQEKVTKQDNSTSKRRIAKEMSARIPFFLRPMARFVYIFFLRRGFLDGRRGLMYAMMMSVYEGMTAVLAYERLLMSKEK